jgi:UTP--glucose-1-phosphate uridylyltransferase
MSTTVRKAVIPAAGLGTRFLPATKAQPKEMLPVVDKPAIQYVVEEAVDAGIDDILVVTGRGKAGIEDHFDRAFELEQQLERTGKLDLLEQVRRIGELADVHYVRQGEPRGLGHAVAVARQHVGDEPFAVLLPDDLMIGGSVLADMVKAHDRLQASVVALQVVGPDAVSLYGCARPEPTDDPALVRVLGVVEKPAPDEAPSDLAVMGRYVFTPAIFGALERVQPGRYGEIQLTDAMALLLADEALYGHVFEGGRFDVGDKLDYLRATVELALARDDLGADFRRILADVVRRHGVV